MRAVKMPTCSSPGLASTLQPTLGKRTKETSVFRVENREMQLRIENAFPWFEVYLEPFFQSACRKKLASVSKGPAAGLADSRGHETGSARISASFGDDSPVLSFLLKGQSGRISTAHTRSVEGDCYPEEAIGLDTNV